MSSFFFFFNVNVGQSSLSIILARSLIVSYNADHAYDFYKFKRTWFGWS